MRIAAFLAILLLASPAYAQQFDIPGASNALQIVTSPAQPAPKSTVRLTLQSPIFNLDEGVISWRVDGEPLSEGDGLRTVSINVGDVGQPIDISATYVSGDDEALAFLTITPAGLGLLWEAEGLTPAFYKGRTLPAAGARLTFVAYPTFIRNGAPVAEKDLIFTWRRGDTVLGSLSGRGKSTAIIDSTAFFASDIISVEARTIDGSISSRASTRLVSPETPLRLYENHPLFGPLYHKAFGATTFTPDSEMTFIAIPYFAPATDENSSALQYEWRVNQQSVAADAKRPSQITINASGSSGVALIELVVSHVTNFFFGSEDAWQVTFSKAGGTAEGDYPFGAQQ
ncbi:MAG: hypothetical protein ACYCZ0_04670 [Minisyncoccota bacterium]